MAPDATPVYRFKTKDCPDANGRQPQSGDQKWTAYFPLDEGGRVYIEMGSEGRSAILSMLAQEDRDDAIPSGHYYTDDLDGGRLVKKDRADATLTPDVLAELERLLQTAPSLDYQEDCDSNCGWPCTPNGCHEGHPSGTYELVGLEESDRGYYTNENQVKLLALVLDHAPALLAAARENAMLKEELEGTEASHEDEEAAHQDTILMWTLQKAKIADLAAENATLRAALEQIAEGGWMYDTGKPCDIPMSYAMAVKVARAALATRTTPEQETPR